MLLNSESRKVVSASWTTVCCACCTCCCACACCCACRGCRSERGVPPLTMKPQPDRDSAAVPPAANRKPPASSPASDVAGCSPAAKRCAMGAPGVTGGGMPPPSGVSTGTAGTGTGTGTAGSSSSPTSSSMVGSTSSGRVGRVVPVMRTRSASACW